MMNNVIMVGRLVSDPMYTKSEDGNDRTNITLAVTRSYKNADGIYETDFVDCVMWGNVGYTTAEFLKKGDMIGIKGRIQTSNYETEDGEKKKSTQVVCDRVTFLNSKSKDKEPTSADMEM